MNRTSNCLNESEDDTMEELAPAITYGVGKSGGSRKWSYEGYNYGIREIVYSKKLMTNVAYWRCATSRCKYFLCISTNAFGDLPLIYLL